MTVLEKYIQEGEHQQQDFKHSISSSKKIAITLSAFANSDGGRLLIGVKDNGKVSGVNIEEELHMIEGAAQVFCKPEVPFKFTVHREKKSNVLEVWIPQSENKPHLAKVDVNKWMAFIRVEDENFLSDPVLLQYWKDNHMKSKVGNKYSDEDKIYLTFLQNNPGFTYKQIAKSFKKPRHITIKTMAKFLSWNLLQFEIDDTGIYYYLKEDDFTFE